MAGWQVGGGIAGGSFILPRVGEAGELPTKRAGDCTDIADDGHGRSGLSGFIDVAFS
jgi:hypothetical protein